MYNFWKWYDFIVLILFKIHMCNDIILETKIMLWIYLTLDFFFKSIIFFDSHSIVR